MKENKYFKCHKFLRKNVNIYDEINIAVYTIKTKFYV